MKLAILLLCIAAAPAKNLVTTSADDVEFPAVEDEKAKPLNLPLIGKALGAEPDVLVGRGEVLNSLKSSPRIGAFLARDPYAEPDFTAKKIRGISATSYAIETYEWWAHGIARADACGFNLTNGRVTRVALFYHTLEPADVNRLGEQLRPFAPTIKRRDVGFMNAIEATVPTSKKFPIGFRCVIWRNKNDLARGDKGTGIVAFTIDPVEWYLRYNDATPASKKALQAGKLVEGMTLPEVMVLRGDIRYVEAGSGIVEWVDRSDYWKDDRVVLRCTFDDSQKLAKIESWDVNAKDAPKP